MKKQTPERAKIVASAGFQKLFAKARKAMNPERTHCKHNHPITAANAHVGDLKRTGRYACDPCNYFAQEKYNAKLDQKKATK